MLLQTTRRTFLKLSTAAAAAIAAKSSRALTAGEQVGVIVDSHSTLASTEPVLWAVEKLREALTNKGFTVSASSGTFNIVVAEVDSQLARIFGPLTAVDRPETTALIPGNYQKTPSVLVAGVDARGFVYGLLELAERIQFEDDPLASLRLDKPLIEKTPNKVRSVARAFLSEIEDKSWFYDRAFWQSYLDKLAYARFNRFNLALGFGYDFPRGVTGDYLHFAYPYLVEVAGYEQVHVEPELHPGERERNLSTLQFIAAETVRRGLEFQLGIWTHAYQWTDSPHSDHRIVGITPEIHAAYCRDALATVLKVCPQITGLTLRIHGESGIPEGSYSFWSTLFEAISGAGRIIEIDMHAKGLNQTMIDIARKTGMPVKVGAKYWAEHLGLGYHQADIRETEYPRKGVTGTFAVSSGERNFTRYGYGDFYREDSGLEILYRVWPGTQRHLLWGDPALASGYGRAAHFCGAAGMELCEPLTFKGREGSGHIGGRTSYVDSSLAGANHDTNKFAITYLLWGRYLYNPDTNLEVYRRFLRQTYGPCGSALGEALANSSRILPLVTTAWLPSASNHSFWPEIYTPTSMLPLAEIPLYGDSPAPHNVSVISPLDPQLFKTIDQHARDLVSGSTDARYSPVDVIDWIELMISTSTESLTKANKEAGSLAATAAFRQVAEDILILNGLGLYYANLFRAALFYSVYEQTGDPEAATLSISNYRKAREAWAGMAERAGKVYSVDISYGDIGIRRGDWDDRLPEIDRDLRALEEHFAKEPAQKRPSNSAIQRILTPFAPPKINPMHTAADTFHPGSDLNLTITTPRVVREAVLWYRHVNQGERWLSMPMKNSDTTYQAKIEGTYTNSAFPIQYYFELRTTDAASLYPPFNPTLSNQPYYAVRSTASTRIG